MIDPIKSCTEINLQDPGLLPTLQCTLQCMGHTQKRITGSQTLLISKLGGWKHSAIFHKSSRTNPHQAVILASLQQVGNYQPSAVLLRKGRIIPNGSVPPLGSKSNKRRLTSLDLKAKVVKPGDGWQVSGRSTDYQDCFFLNDPTADQPHQPTRISVHHQHQQAEAMTNSSRTPQT